ncbi:Maf family nucleotide pyrophosphatase [Deinococcus multiflagellatus]|uniref:Maf family nucleotide pyrophosphatase n=1 Tax=Deinococcus multiflagellatus TaxID=1656887 RepID=UPI001CCEE057|nr:Maf family nucleotide pyrophosphatase [Deinococcus multiflagellatus]MBZ9712042.1 Maf family nucleotide pyrophosphatase [Deinococcus multiflagellatus]
MTPQGSGAGDAGPQVILASGSPRRRELLGLLGVRFTVQVSGEAEDSSDTDPARLAAELARLKGRAVARTAPGAVVLAADTVVAIEGELLGKPADRAENEAFVRRLSGRTHEVFTGVAVLQGGREQVEVARTAVTFRALSDAEIAYYAATGEGLDKAGGYGIQAVGMALVARVDGEYANVVGLPLTVTTRLLRAAGVPVWGQAAGVPGA